MKNLKSNIEQASRRVADIQAQIARCDGVIAQAQQSSKRLTGLLKERADLKAHAFAKQESCDTAGIDAQITEAEQSTNSLRSEADTAQGACEMLADQLAEAEKLLDLAQQDRKLQCYELLAEERERAQSEYEQAMEAVRLSLIHMDAIASVAWKYQQEHKPRIESSQWIRKKMCDGQPGIGVSCANSVENDFFFDPRVAGIGAEIVKRLGLDI